MQVALGTEGVITGVKESSGDDVSFRRLIAMNVVAGHPLALFTGHEVMVDAMGLFGADDAVPGWPTLTLWPTCVFGTPSKRVM